MTLEGLNHLLQEAETGLPNGHGWIEQTMSPKAMNLVSSRIRQNIVSDRFKQFEDEYMADSNPLA
ncbi:MAG: hypothetical protein O7G85_13615 [Planctomycetota bacterium]|nr:hypothetical protein [Planctomycetota bacterium]